MFIRQVKKQRSKNAKVFFQYNLVQASRIEGKVKQRIILYLGSEVLLSNPVARNNVLNILMSKIFNIKDLGLIKYSQEEEKLAEHYFQKYLVKYKQTPQDGASIPPPPKKAEFHNVDIKGLKVDDTRSFGAEHLCKQMLEKLNLEQHLRNLGFEYDQIQKALITIAARALFSSSEHKTAQLLERDSELKALYKYDKPLTHRMLYQVADSLYQHKDALDNAILKQLTTLFQFKNKLVIYDLSNTYFETSKRGSTLAKHGRSKERRSDCPIVTLAASINEEGFIQYSKIYKGNTVDSDTLSDMIVELDKQSSDIEQKTVVIDAGIATDDNLELIARKGYKYVAVARKRLKDYPSEVLENVVEMKTKHKESKVKLKIFNPKGYTDTWMYVQSEEKRRKEESIQDKLCGRMEEELESLRKGLSKKGTVKKADKICERIGRIREQYKMVSSRYTIDIEKQTDKVKNIRWTKKVNSWQEDKDKGIYFIRTNHEHHSASDLWDIYNTIREVEATFRCLKSDLQIRPIFHQKDRRIESHIYLTILAYQLVNSIRYKLKQKGIHHDWKNCMCIMNTQRIQTVVLPTDKKNIHLRLPSKPIKEAKDIYDATNCKNTQTAIKKYVVYH